MDTSLAAPDKEVDVHMDATGLDFTCSTCHKAPAHDVVGSRYMPTGKDAGEGLGARPCGVLRGEGLHPVDGEGGLGLVDEVDLGVLLGCDGHGRSLRSFGSTCTDCPRRRSRASTMERTARTKVRLPAIR